MRAPRFKSKVLADVVMVPVETRSSRRMFRVDVGQWQAGWVEKLPARAGEIHPWKAFRGIGHGSRFVAAFYEADGGMEAAVLCVLDRK